MPDAVQQTNVPTFVPTGGSGFVSSPALHPQFAVWSLSFDELIDSIEHRLRGDISTLNSDKTLTWKHKYDPLMNDFGINKIGNYLRGLTSTVISLSNASEAQCYADILDNCLAIDSDIYLNYRKYGVSSTNYSLIVTELSNFIEYSFLKAREGNMQEFVHPKWNKNLQVFEASQSPQKKSGPLSFIGL